MRPSARAVWAEQKMSRTSVWFSRGTAVNVPATGSHTVGETAPRQLGPPSQKRILPVSRRTIFMATIGSLVTGLAGILITEDHWPTWAPVPLETVTVTPVDVVALPAAS